MSAKQFKTIPGGPWNREAWADARLTMLFKIIDDLVAIQSVIGIATPRPAPNLYICIFYKYFLYPFTDVQLYSHTVYT